MSGKWKFPYDIVPHGTRIVLYGAGNYGRWIYVKNRETNWCSIVSVIDKKGEAIKDFPAPVHGISEITANDEYEYVYIAILNNDIRKEVTENLINQGVSASKIRFLEAESDDLDSFKNVYIDDTNNDGNEIKVGLAVGWPVGDQVIALKIYQSIINVCPQAEMYVFCNNPEITKVLYWGQKGLNKILGYTPSEEEARQYDVFIYAEHIPRLTSFRRSKIKRLSETLYQSMMCLYEYQMNEPTGAFLPVAQRRILLDRAKFFGKNRYTLLGISGAFEIKDQKVTIFQKEGVTNPLEGLDYITVHYGASDVLKDGKKQVKIWPFEYYEELCSLIREKYPDIKLVQLGGKEEPIIKETDYQFMGESFELVEKIITDSKLHFDCESGLVHVATQLGVKCFVVFGPTPIWYFGYEGNCNIGPKVCGECKGLLNDWYTHCIKYDSPKCMESITAQMVFEKIEDYLKNG